MTKALGVSLLAGALVLAVGIPARAAGGLVEQAALTGASDAFFGYSVAIDGDTAVVGAVNDGSAQGAVYVYVRSGGAWALQQKVVASDGAASDELGYAVAVSGDTLFASASVKGVVYVFTRSGPSWTQQAEIAQPAAMPGDCFGCSLALRGTIGIVGASGHFSSTGAAYVFGGAGSSWTLQQQFIGQTSGDAFGFSVALTEDGATALIGAYGANGAAGRAYVETSDGMGHWTQQTVLQASDAQANARFGYAVAASGNTALVGAYGLQSSQGAAYVFSRSGTAWASAAKLTATDGAANDLFGFSVGLSGTTAAVGAFEKNSTHGAAYVFTSSGGSWTPQEFASPLPDAASFGYSVAASASTVLVGAFSTGNDSGAALAFAPPGVTVPPVPALPTFWGVALLSLALGIVAYQASFSRGDRRS